jgi:hypothetical protein
MKNFSFVTTSLIIASLSGCVAVPEYKQIANDANGAYIVPRLTTVKLLAGATTVDVVNGRAVCGEKYPDPKRIFRLAQGNPLISSLNPDGAWVPSGMPINIVVMVMMDGFNCGQALAFLPEQGGKYRLDINGKSSFSQYTPPTCEILISKIDGAGKDLGPAPELRPLACIEKSQVK